MHDPSESESVTRKNRNGTELVNGGNHVNHRRSQDVQLGGLKFDKSYPTAGTDPENFSGGDTDLN